MKTKKTTSKPVNEVKKLATPEIIETPKDQPEKTDTLFGIKKLYVLIPLVIILVGATLYYFRNQIVVATVNGQPIMRWELIRELEKQGGKRVLDNIALQRLIEQEAAKQNVTISQDELNQEIQNIEGRVAAQGQKLETLLALDNMTREDLIGQIRIQKLVEKLSAAEIQITDQEVTDFVNANKQTFPQGTTEEEMRSQAKQQLEEQKKDENVQTWLQQLKEKGTVTTLLPL